MKRTRVDYGGESLNLHTARCLLLLSQQSASLVGWADKKPKLETRYGVDKFGCKTCGRTFSSFQALGGHRASHKLMQNPSTKLPSEPAKADGGNGLSGKTRMHECAICGLGFPTGQALGGHMKKHRTDVMNGTTTTTTALYPAEYLSPMIPVLKRTNSSKRIACVDLNLTPLENDLRLLLGNVPPNIQLQKQHF